MPLRAASANASSIVFVTLTSPSAVMRRAQNQRIQPDDAPTEIAFAVRRRIESESFDEHHVALPCQIVRDCVGSAVPLSPQFGTITSRHADEIGAPPGSLVTDIRMRQIDFHLRQLESANARARALSLHRPDPLKANVRNRQISSSRKIGSHYSTLSGSSGMSKEGSEKAGKNGRDDTGRVVLQP